MIVLLPKHVSCGVALSTREERPLTKQKTETDIFPLLGELQQLMHAVVGRFLLDEPISYTLCVGLGVVH